MKLKPAQSLSAMPVGWTVYTIMMVGLCLALTFPYDSLHAMLLVRLSERTGLDIHAEQWRLQLPAGVIWNHPSIFMPGVERIDAEQLQVQVKLSSVLRGQPVLVWSGTIGGRKGSGGRLSGELSLGTLSWSGPAQALGTMEHLDLSSLALPLVKKGLLRARFERRWTDLSAAERSRVEEGTWHIELTDVELEQLPVGPYPLPPLTLSSLSGRLECHSGTCRLESLRGESQDGMFSGEGEIVLHDPLPTSHLSLTLSVIMTEALKEHLHLTHLGLATPGLPQKLTVSGPLSNLQMQ